MPMTDKEAVGRTESRVGFVCAAWLQRCRELREKLQILSKETPSMRSGMHLAKSQRHSPHCCDTEKNTKGGDTNAAPLP
jgi:hypothetical protein